ncbi:MAG: class I SAM-dependent methyltransferase [Nanoarchaeota archaeon]
MKSQRDTWDKLYGAGLEWKRASNGIFNVRNKSVLELGVGNGKTLKTILDRLPKKVVAIDISKEAISMVKESIQHKGILYITKDFLKFKTRDKFDIIVCYYFLNNFKERVRIKVVNMIKSLLKKDGIILFEDFAVGDFRQKGKEIDQNTIQKQNGLICHFFEKNEILELFKGFGIEIQEKSFEPIRKSSSIKRHIINAIIRTR